MKSPFHRTASGRASSTEASATDPRREDRRSSLDEEFPPTERPSQPFDGRVPWPLSARVAVPWVGVNAVVRAGVLGTRPVDQSSAPPTSIAETVAPTAAGDLTQQGFEVAAERGATPPAAPGAGSNEPAAPPEDQVGTVRQQPEEQQGDLTIYPVLVVEGRLYALEGAAQDVSGEGVLRTRRTRTLALPGGGALGITPRAEQDGELPTGTWTVLSTAGTCLTERGPSVRLRFDSGEPGAPQPPALDAHALDGCSIDHDTTDRAVAISGAHPKARFEAIAEGSVKLQGGGRAVDTTSDSCASGVRITTRSGELLSDQPGVELAGRITLDGRELLMLEGAGRGGGLRVVDVGGDSVTLAAQAPFSPLWLGGTDC